MATRPALPSEMTAAIVDRFGPPEVVHTTRVPVPKLGRRELLIRVAAAAVGEWDPSLVDGSFRDTRRELPTIFGSDGAGVVEATGPAVTQFSPGDAVYGWGFGNKKGGFFAEYVAVNERAAAQIPGGLSMREAAALPISGITALQGLDHLELLPGQDLIITGASGGVGHVAVQLAKLLGAHVFAVASGADGVALATRLGADTAVEGHDDDGVEREAHAFAPDGFDAALVFAGAGGWKTLLSLVKPGGRIVWPNGVEPQPLLPSSVKWASYDGEKSPEDFARLNALIAEGPFHVEIARDYPLEATAQALRDVQRHHVGKLEIRLQ